MPDRVRATLEHPPHRFLICRRFTCTVARRVEGAGDGRTAAARRRARLAKRSLVILATVGFGAWMLLARMSYAGHPKHAVRPLAVPEPMYQVVRRNLLQSGILAPATAPPDATTSTS